MDNQTVVAGSSPAEMEDVFGGQQTTLGEYSHYRLTGELPARFKPEETEPNDAPEETAVAAEDDEEPSEIDPNSEPEEETQEPPKGSGAEKRIKQLLAKQKELERKLEAVAKPDVKPEPSPAQTQYTRPKPQPTDTKPDGTLVYDTYEDFVDARSDWNAEQKLESYKQQQIQQEAQKILKGKLDDARARYDDADEIIFPAAKAINESQMPRLVKDFIDQSELFPHLLYVLNSDADELPNLISLAMKNPRAAISKITEYERGIREELDKKEPTGKAPEPKRTAAPKPPAPVGGASSRAFDVSDESLSAEQWAAKRTADLAKRGKR